MSLNSPRKIIKVAILHPIASPYRTPLFAKLAEDPNIHLKVFFDVESMSNRPFWGYIIQQPFESEVLKAIKVRLPWRIRNQEKGYSVDGFSLVPTRIPFALRRFRPDVVISTEVGIRTFLGLIYANIYGKRLIVWSDEYLGGLSKHSRVRILLRQILIRHVDGFCSCGRANKEFLRVIGAQEKRISHVSIAIDNDYFQRGATEGARQKIRGELNLRGTVFLNVGQFIQRKGLDRLLSAWSGIPDRVSRRSSLLLVGGGVEEGNLKSLAQSLRLRNVFFVPFKPIDQLPSYYAAADIFVFPTLEDGWGLVVNEAMACGQPILCSKYAGCVHELVRNGENGFVFDPMDLDDTRRGIVSLFDIGPDQHRRMRERSKEIVAEFTYQRMVEGFRRAIYDSFA